MRNRWMIVVVLASSIATACGGQTQDLQPPPPLRPQPKTETVLIPSKPLPGGEAAADDGPDPRAIPPTGPFPAAGPACMPAGRYHVTWDLISASITQQGHSAMADCRQFAQIIPEQNMATVTLDFTDGALVVHWPSLQLVVATSECEFAVTSAPVKATIKFTDGKGAGTADYAVGSPNHPEESCDVTGAKVELVREKW